jgi:hypothetical protein
MFVTAVPRIGDVLTGRDALGRTLRVSAHPGSGRLVLSIWQEGACLATVRLDAEGLERLSGVLAGLAATLDSPNAYPEAG